MSRLANTNKNIMSTTRNNFIEEYIDPIIYEYEIILAELNTSSLYLGLVYILFKSRNIYNELDENELYHLMGQAVSVKYPNLTVIQTDSSAPDAIIVNNYKKIVPDIIIGKNENIIDTRKTDPEYVLNENIFFFRNDISDRDRIDIVGFSFLPKQEQFEDLMPDHTFVGISKRSNIIPDLVIYKDRHNRRTNTGFVERYLDF